MDAQRKVDRFFDDSKWATPGITLLDSVHSYVDLPWECREIMDTPQFQRLRDLSQLGMTKYVFPCATHSRFEHCIGVAHLAGSWLQRFKTQQPELELTEADIRQVEVAGLCHDLGHGPFSHAFEAWVHSRGILDFHHETMSCRMLEYLIDDNGLDVPKQDLCFIQDLILGKTRRGLLAAESTSKPFLFDIVANRRNGIDVDKWDYLMRDTKQIGIHGHGSSSVSDFNRLIRYSRVIDQQICFQEKEVHNLYNLFHTRHNMYTQVYYHRTTQAVEFMVQDMLNMVQDKYHFLRDVSNPERYAQWTDHILKEIETSTDTELAPARSIVRDIRKRKFYPFVDMVMLPSYPGVVAPRGEDPKTFYQCTPDILAQYIPPSAQVSTKDILVNHLELNYAMRDQNPVDRVRFYSKYQPNSSFVIASKTVSHLLPQEFLEKAIRVYVRDPTKVEATREGFQKWMRSRGINPNCESFALTRQVTSVSTKGKHKKSSGLV